MTYQETIQPLSIESIERLALVLSRRPDKSEFAATAFAEIIRTCRASHVVFWRRDLKTESSFHAVYASTELDKTEHFDASVLAFWNGWESGEQSIQMLDETQLLSLRRLDRSQQNSQDHDVTAKKTPWTKHNMLVPLSTQNGSIGGMLSVHQSAESLVACHEFFSPTLIQLISNCLLLDKRDAHDNQLASELWLERNLRLITARVHARVDRDFVLQSAVDSLGNVLKVSSCLVLRLEPGSTARVTHEFVDPELSPLGLGWSSFIPNVIAAQMCERTTILEETGIRKHEQGQYLEGMESLFESSIRSLAGTAILINAESFGALVVQSNRERKWQRHELKLLEGSAAAIGMALRNAELYQEAKAQVFNLNLLTNLTRQLGSAVEQLFKQPAASDPAAEEASMLLEANKVPLSGRELEVLRLIASGMSNREIAQHLFLTESTVELHASRIRKKLKLKSRTALVKFACDNHLV